MGTKRGLDEEILEMLQRTYFSADFCPPPTRHGRHSKILPEQVATQSGQKRHERRALQKPAAQGVCHRHATRPHGLQSPGTPSIESFLSSSRSQKSSSHGAGSSTGSSPLNVFQEHAVIPDRQILALDHGIPQVAGEIGLLKIGLVGRDPGSTGRPGIVGAPGPGAASDA